MIPALEEISHLSKPDLNRWIAERLYHWLDLTWQAANYWPTKYTPGGWYGRQPGKGKVELLRHDWAGNDGDALQLIGKMREFGYALELNVPARITEPCTARFYKSAHYPYHMPPEMEGGTLSLTITRACLWALLVPAWAAVNGDHA